jgi:hypothetical protein
MEIKNIGKIQSIYKIFPTIKSFNIKKYIFYKYRIKNNFELKLFIKNNVFIMEEFVVLESYINLNQYISLNTLVITIHLNNQNKIIYKINSTQQSLKYINERLKNSVTDQKELLNEKEIRVLHPYLPKCFFSRDFKTEEFIKIFKKKITQKNIENF